MTTDWLTEISHRLMRLEGELRLTLRAHTRCEDHPRIWGRDTILITTNEARTLLHGAIPVPITTTRLREPHARVVVALSAFHRHLLAHNEAGLMTYQPQIVLQAAMQLVGELRTWHRVVQWRAACRRANVKIPLPQDHAQGSISPIMRLQTGSPLEQTKTAAKPALKSAFASAAQGELDLGLQRGAEMIDIRQLQFQLSAGRTDAHDTAAA